MSDLTKDDLRRMREACACHVPPDAVTGSVDGCEAQGCDVVWFRLADLPPMWRARVDSMPALLTAYDAKCAEVERLRAEDKPPPVDVALQASANRYLVAEVERLRAMLLQAIDIIDEHVPGETLWLDAAEVALARQSGGAR